MYAVKTVYTTYYYFYKITFTLYKHFYKFEFSSMECFDISIILLVL